MRRNLNKKYIFMKYIITALITALLVLLYIRIFESDDSMEMKQLKSYNDSLHIINNKLNTDIVLHIDDINKQDSLIKKLYYKQKKIYNVIDSLNNQLITINNKYEKANHYSDSLNTFQLKSYFSNLK